MKLLHTSDWHLGRTLYGRKRYDEFSAFLDWLLDTINTNQIDLLLVAGDVFDTSTPPNKAQELYYNFLCQVANSCCRHVVIIGGNHDSPSFLDAPKALLKALNVYVVGTMTEAPHNEVIVLYDLNNKPEALVCAVPYLRDKDIRSAEAGESIEDKNSKLIQGLKTHYHQVCTIAEQLQAQFSSEYEGLKVPLIGMGHLFAAGGQTIEGDGVRELYVGSLAHVSASIFPASIDYLALGHLHSPQIVGGQEHMRYSGSPIPMGYGEAKQQKKVIEVVFSQGKPHIQEIPVPCFQALERISGSLDIIQTRIAILKEQKSAAWLEIDYTGSELVANLRELLDQALDGSSMEIRRIKNKRVIERVMNKACENETLDDLNPHDVFQRCLDANEIPDEERSEIIAIYQDIIRTILEEDLNAE